MLRKAKIRHFKSILDDEISLGRINVFIGENGSGKSNILEGLMFASAALKYDSIDPDLLYTNGIRVSKPSLILSSFNGKQQSKKVRFMLEFDDFEVDFEVKPEHTNDILSKWNTELLNSRIKNKKTVKSLNHFFDGKEEDIYKLENLIQSDFLNVIESHHINKKKKISTEKKSPQKETDFDKFSIPRELLEVLTSKLRMFILKKNSTDFKKFTEMIVYSLSTEALRGIPEFQKSKKGVYGETLDLIINELDSEEIIELKSYLYTVSWIEDFFIDTTDEYKKKGYKLNFSESPLYFRDKYMQKKNNVFSAENSNEGILHIMFYLANIISKKTPSFFAIDNIESALNPHLCQHIMEEISKLSKIHEKQMLITTHNPAILDGLNLYDDDIRLFEVIRTDDGATRTRRIKLKPEVEDKKFKLSELWTRGYLGAISEKF